MNLESSNEQPAIIDLDQVSVTTGDVTMLAPITLSVKRGEALVVRGENGAGKSTLLRVLAGGQRPSTGSARIEGKPIEERDRVFRRRVSAMIGLPPMAPDLTVFDHVAMVAATWMSSPQDTKHTAQGVLAELGLTTLGRRFPHELSSGQTQLFGLALVLVRPSDVLILDEPEQRLDPDRLTTVARVLNRRLHDGTTLVVATHSQALTDEIAGQTIMLHGES